MASVVKRRAKIFEAGNYPDKGGEYPVSELDTWIENHKARDIPLSVGHLDMSSNPLAKLGEFGMGFLRNLQRIGAELFADVFLDEDVNRLLERGASKALSIGIDRDSGLILEASLVSTPRVASAAIFHKDVAYQFSVDLDLSQAPIQPQEGQMSNEPQGAPATPPQTPPVPPAGEQFADELKAQRERAEAADKRADQLEAETRELRRNLQFQEDEKKLDALVGSGKLLPAQAKQLATAFSSFAPAKVTFAAGDTPAEMTAIDAVVKFFADYDPEVVMQARKPALREITRDNDVEKFSDSETEVIRERGRQQGYTGDELEKYVAQSQKLKEAVNG